MVNKGRIRAGEGSMTPFKDVEKQKVYMREYQRKQRELFKKLKKEKEEKGEK